LYHVSDTTSLLRAHRRLLSRSGDQVRVKRTVLLLGLTSLFTDISSEMVASVLPAYLIGFLRMSPAQFGVMDGLYQGVASFAGLASGVLGDRSRRHKEVAVTGYGLSAICKLALATVGTALSAIGAIVLIDRIGKGIRTAPRDAMISLSTPKDQLGVAFGVHRALDTTGALLGPLAAFGLLAVAPLAFDSLFMVSFCVALIGLAILVLLVNPRRDITEAPLTSERASLREALGLLRNRRFRGFVIVGSALSLATVSDAFIFLALQKRLDLGTSMFPLLFVGSSITFMVLAVPVGRLADRIGRGRVLIGGYALLLAVYVSIVTGLDGWPLLVIALGLLGTYYAATDGVLMALGSEVVPQEIRGSGLALLQTASNASRFLASVMFGGLWALIGINAALACFGGALAAASLVAVTVLKRTRVSRA
jgi:MFS family permease